MQTKYDLVRDGKIHRPAVQVVPAKCGITTALHGVLQITMTDKHRIRRYYNRLQKQCLHNVDLILLV